MLYGGLDFINKEETPSLEDLHPWEGDSLFLHLIDESKGAAMTLTATVDSQWYRLLLILNMVHIAESGSKLLCMILAYR